MFAQDLTGSPNVDLHCHSTASDGTLADDGGGHRAHEQGVRVLALTDHDTVAGIGEARAGADARGMVLITGIELSCLWRGQTIHVVGLDFDGEDSDLVAAVEGQEAVRHQRARTIDERLCQKGLPSVLADAQALAAGVPGRPHFAQALVERGVVAKSDAAFRRYLGNGRVGDIKACWPDLSDAVQWITHAGGKAVLAHPRKYRLTNNKLRQLIGAFTGVGGSGIEVLSSGQSPHDTTYLARLCRESGCTASGVATSTDPVVPGANWGNCRNYRPRSILYGTTSVTIPGGDLRRCPDNGSRG